MNTEDALLELLIEFFALDPNTRRESVTHDQVANWDSLAMVQLIAELQSRFGIQFDLGEIEKLGSYEEIRAALVRKGVSL